MLGTCLNVRRAVDAVGLSCSAAYQLKRRDPEFARGWAEALDEGYTNLEFEMLRQSIEGCERTETVKESPDGPVKQVKIIHSYPHNVAMRLLQAHREEVLAFRHAEAGGGRTRMSARRSGRIWTWCASGWSRRAWCRTAREIRAGAMTAA